jgi:predicted CopG family antitoxin
MPTDVIRISEEAKDRLTARKREDESYTDVVLRLTDRDDDVDRFIGKYADVDLAAGVEAVKDRADRDFHESREETNVRGQ